MFIYVTKIFLYAGEPNNSGGEHCIHILTNRNGWNDLPCTHTSIYTMCEKPGEWIWESAWCVRWIFRDF